MKMMRIIAIILIMASVTALFACGTVNNSKDETNDILTDEEKGSIVLLDEYESYVTDKGLTETIVKENMKDRKVTIFGEDYVGVYQETRSGRSSYMTDCYQDALGREFYFRCDTDELDGFDLSTLQLLNRDYYLDDVKEPQKHAEELAKEIAQTYVDDIDEYEMVTKSSITDREKDGKTYYLTRYTIEFIKKVAGYETLDKVTVGVNSKGTVFFVSVGDIDVFSDADLKIDKEALDKSIDLAVTNDYENSSYQVIGYNIRQQKLYAMFNGDVCIVTSLGVNLKTEVGDEFATGVMIMTKIGERVLAKE